MAWPRSLPPQQIRPVALHAAVRRRLRARTPQRDDSMANKMLIDATHPEETRVVVVRGNRVEEFDFESATRRQLRGNIYLAKVTRVEPSLQAAFVDYGGNRHGFLAFSEIHPDYYQIPVADRQALIAEEERAHRDAEDEVERRSRSRRRHRTAGSSSRRSETVRSDRVADAEARAEERSEAAPEATAGDSDSDRLAFPDTFSSSETAPVETPEAATANGENAESTGGATPEVTEVPSQSDEASAEVQSHAESAGEESLATGAEEGAEEHASNADTDNSNGAENEEDEVVESVGGADALEEALDRAPRFRRQYKIQEVIKRRQIMLVQVVKEERGTKGAALTTYLSLAGRYCVLMPNSARGGGVSRKITSAQDRRRLKQIVGDLELPKNMAVILRTAGAERNKAEIKRDYEYLQRTWNLIREVTMNSRAPALIHEEASLIKRAIRDIYSRDIEEIW